MPKDGADARALLGDAIRADLCVNTWRKLEIPPPDKILGDVITTTTRTFISGKTGLGKTLFGVALATAMAAGADFLHWKCYRAARVLYIDGEMPSELIKSRCEDELRRLKMDLPDGQFVIFARDREEWFAEKYPQLGMFAPLNTPEGLRFIIELVDLVRPDVVIFDNVMSLLVGDQRAEIAWSDVNALVNWLTRHRIGQVWFDHTGHDTSRQYGSSTKAWRFDNQIILKPLGKDEAADVEAGCAGFELSFEKARRRMPSNWQEFVACTITLEDDKWQSILHTNGAFVSKEAQLLKLIETMSAKVRGSWLDREVVREAAKEAGLLALDENGNVAVDARQWFGRKIVKWVNAKKLQVNSKNQLRLRPKDSG